MFITTNNSLSRLVNIKSDKSNFILTRNFNETLSNACELAEPVNANTFIPTHINIRRTACVTLIGVIYGIELKI